MLNAIKNFSADEAGAVTVDWVVLTAALVGLGLAVMGVVSGGIQDITQDIGGALCSDVTNTTGGFRTGTTALTGGAINAEGVCQ